MAQQVIVTMTDDTDGTESTESDKVETRRFALGMHVFEIDLTGTNYEGLKKLLAPYTANARPASNEYRRTVAPVNARTNGSHHTTHVHPPRDVASRARCGNIRRWAKEQGLQVGEKGRIPRDIEEKYDAAHPTAF